MSTITIDDNNKLNPKCLYDNMKINEIKELLNNFNMCGNPTQYYKEFYQNVKWIMCTTPCSPPEIKNKLNCPLE